MQHQREYEKRRSFNARIFLITLLACLLAAALILTLNTLLHTRIAGNQTSAAEQPLLEAFPQSQRHHVILKKAGMLNDRAQLGLRAATPFYRAFADGNQIGWLLPAIAREGYGGDIELVVALDWQGKILGVQVLQHRETIGLGDRIEREHSNWLNIFHDRSLQNPGAGQWFLRSDNGVFDGISGATVTTRSVTSAVKQTLEYYQSHQAELANSATGAAR